MRFLTGLTVAIVAVSGTTSHGAPTYVGANKCAKMCHKGATKGQQLEIWQKSDHAKAYATLATPAALETAKKVGLTEDPQKSDKCLKCHVTGFGLAAASFDSTFSMKDGVQCEACHGPGSDYGKLKIMKDKAAATAAGLVEPTEALCVKCHNKESPSYKPFVFAEYSKKIEHKKPTAAPAATK